MLFAALEQRILAFPERFTSGKGAAVAEIEDAEHQLGLKITGGYREFLLRFGWMDIGLVELFGIGEDIPPYLNLVIVTLSERSEMRPNLALMLLPFHNDGFGNLYCLDMAASVGDEHPVVFWNHECGSGQIPEPVSNSFAEWLSAEIG